MRLTHNIHCMLTLYYKETCPFCQRVLQNAENLGVEFNLKEITESEEAAAELLEKGGKTQVPYLVDEKNGVAMYESSDIIDYIREHKAEFSAKEGGASENKPRVHISSSVCESCEG